MTKRRNFSDKFRAAVSLEALRGDNTVQEIAAQRQLHPTRSSQSIVGFIDGKGALASRADHGNLFVADQIRFRQRVAPIALALHLIINTKLLQFFACGLRGIGGIRVKRCLVPSNSVSSSLLSWALPSVTVWRWMKPSSSTPVWTE